jgi:uncharacterized membrane protein YqjE
MSEQLHERGVLPVLISMLGTRLELAALDSEAHVQATLLAVLKGLAALVLALVSFTFIGVMVIVIFWDTHRIAAAVGVLAAYASLAAMLALAARAGWKSRPAAFAATLRELELDREAFRGRP